MAIEQKVDIPRWHPDSMKEDAKKQVLEAAPWLPPDPINPSHYKQHPSGIEAIEITQHYNFCIGNAIKYLWRNGLKKDEGSSAVKDLKKAIWYIEREISNIERGVY